MTASLLQLDSQLGRDGAAITCCQHLLASLLPAGLSLKVLEMFRTHPARVCVKGFAAQCPPAQQADLSASLEGPHGQMGAGETTTHDQDVLPSQPQAGGQIDRLAVLQGFCRITSRDGVHPARQQRYAHPRGNHQSAGPHDRTVAQAHLHGCGLCLIQVDLLHRSRLHLFEQLEFLHHALAERAEQARVRQTVGALQFAAASPFLGKAPQRIGVGVRMVGRRGAQPGNLAALHLLLPT